MADINNETMKETLNNRPKSHLETYQNEIIEYLTSKLEIHNVPKHTIMEIAQYCYTATLLTANDEVRRNFRHWEKHQKKGTRR